MNRGGRHALHERIDATAEVQLVDAMSSQDPRKNRIYPH
jgi:hypothetical protein